jgi:hypothetical protein
LSRYVLLSFWILFNDISEPPLISGIVDDQQNRGDDVVEISPSKKLRTDNLESLGGSGTFDALERQKECLHVWKTVTAAERTQRARSVRTDTLGFNCTNGKFLEEAMENVLVASTNGEGTEEDFAAV